MATSAKPGRAGAGTGARKARVSAIARASASGRAWSPSSEVAGASSVAVSRDGNPALVSEAARAHEVYNAGPSEQPSGLQMERMTQTLSLLFQQRIVRCGGSVDDDMANLLVAQLLYLDAENPNRDVTMYINSPGGSVTAGMSIFDTMRHIRPNVSTVTVGLAASMGAFIAATGTPGKRYALPNSRIMIHQPLGGAQGQAADIEIQANEIMHHKATLNGYLAQFTGQSLDRITEDTDRDFFMGAHEAKDYGLVDEIIMSTRAQEVQQSNIPMYASSPP